MSYSIALNFEDGVTRFIECGAQETVLDAAFRQKINLPMDCADGVCGSCKCRAQSGVYDLGEDYIEEALSAQEAREGLALSCQMRPKSDCVLAIPAASTACKIGPMTFEARVRALTPCGDAAVWMELECAAEIPFLAGQYVNITVPQSGVTRSYSFASAPAERGLSLLIKAIPEGVMGGWLGRATLGETLTLSGPYGSFYLRETDPARPIVMLAGGTGLGPFLSMLAVLGARKHQGVVHLCYAVTRLEDLVELPRIAQLAAALPNFALTTVVADPRADHPRLGFVTEHMPEALFTAAQEAQAEVDTYLCGPPPMVDAVRGWFARKGLAPARFYYEKFTPNAAQPATASPRERVSA